VRAAARGENETVTLTDVLLAHAGPAREKLAAAAGLDETLARLVEAGGRAWPRVALGPEAFARHIAERVADADDPVKALGALHAGDLFLACACAGGDAAALGELDRQFIARLKTPPPTDSLRVTPEDLRQMVRARLLVAQGGQPPRIAGYNGRGPLLHWLRVAVARLTVDLRRAGRPDAPLEEHQERRLRTAAPDPELNYLKDRYLREFEEAFEATLAGLDVREANILRLFFQEGMTTIAIGKLYKVSDRTVQRWIVALRQKILDETHRRLAERLRLPPSEVGSIYDLVQSRVAISLAGWLGGRGGAADPTPE
jgi:RNA polymerase sigma-70 factor (ECF subfamily)